MTELSKKADIALADLEADGGKLNREQSTTFIRNLVDQPTILNAARVVPMNGPEARINKIGFATDIMRPASQDTTANSAVHQGRALAASQRVKPTTSYVDLNTKEVMAEIHIPYEVLEDNIEKGGMNNTILALISSKMSSEMGNLALNGKVGAFDGVDGRPSNIWLNYMDGWITLADDHIYDAANAPVSAAVFNSALKQMPTPYRANRSAMRFMSSMDVESDYRLAVSNRGTNLGDAILTGTQALPVFGVPLISDAHMGQDKLLFTNPKNMIMGIQRSIRIETDRIIRERVIVIVVTARIAFAVEENDAFVQVNNLAAT